MTPDIQALIEKLTAQADWYSGFASNDYHEAVATMREAADALEQFQWRDIASAPRDRTMFLADGDDVVPYVCWWSGLMGAFMRIYVDGTGEASPTRYMPLPPPPKRGEPC